jgi:hypothetical protein
MSHGLIPRWIGLPKSLWIQKERENHRGGVHRGCVVGNDDNGARESTNKRSETKQQPQVKKLLKQ